MVKSLGAIKQPIEQELTDFEVHFRQSMRSHVPLLDKITYYIVKRKGKQVRPMFVFLAAKTCGAVNPSTFIAASLIELLHTATLVHDDVVDDALERRSFFSVNAIWKNKIAVLVGDYLFSQGMLLALKNKEFQLLEIVSDAVKAMSEGELLQIEKARRLDIKEAVYYEIIRQKTASLIASACSAGAASINTDPEPIEKMRLFGEKIGLAFQIRDDLFDFGSEDVGKPLGIDIKEKKLTLPLIHALEHASQSDKKRIINIVKRHHMRPEKVQEVIDFVQDSNGLRYAKEVMYQFREEAFDILRTFPHSAARQSLEDLVIFVTERKK
ncbi:MAG: polyprenyl synthetase family protein [Saprospiraceae bacterium]|jgi:octaprenyl-diphosphate synthase|nr:polyprenyl synthetase family protein [Saprospiraceae bacterium]MDP4819711.1 polyprenyl synthetase family protein [Saprospiraceae bacterium]MDP4998593.1 polyprenyl synthetase family protein [Saprospiraceae bacterium]